MRIPHCDVSFPDGIYHHIDLDSTFTMAIGSTSLGFGDFVLTYQNQQLHDSGIFQDPSCILSSNDIYD